MNRTAQTMQLYQGGASVGSVQLTVSLRSLADSANYLGRSQFTADPEFSGSIQEFRIYGMARSAAQIQASFTAGPDALPTQ